MRVLVTGAAGYFGSQVLPALLEDPRITSVLGTDRRSPALLHPKLTFERRDLDHDPFEDLLAASDAVIHLAFRVERRPGENVESTNLGAHHRFLKAACAQSEALVVASSLAAYGLREEPFDKLSEEAPVAPGRGVYYCEHKIAAERLLDALERNAKARIVRARPCSVAGPTIDPKRALQFKGRLHLIPKVSHMPRLQVLHEHDLGPAFRTLLFAPAGAYNVAPDDVLDLDEAARLAGQIPIRVPSLLYKAAADLTWRLGTNALDAAWARMNDYPTLVGDNAKLKSLGWRPTKGTREAVRDTVRAVRKEPS